MYPFIMCLYVFTYVPMTLVTLHVCKWLLKFAHTCIVRMCGERRFVDDER